MELFHWCTMKKIELEIVKHVPHKYNILFACQFLDKKCLLSTEVIPVYCVFFPKVRTTDHINVWPRWYFNVHMYACVLYKKTQSKSAFIYILYNSISILKSSHSSVCFEINALIYVKFMRRYIHILHPLKPRMKTSHTRMIIGTYEKVYCTVSMLCRGMGG